MSEALNVPSTDDEVLLSFNDYSDTLLRQIMSGLYRVKRAQGLSVMDAYEFCLRSFLDASATKATA
jgi:hypothetical protein